jgi:hypothetical protein
VTRLSHHRVLPSIGAWWKLPKIATLVNFIQFHHIKFALGRILAVLDEFLQTEQRTRPLNSEPKA